MHNTRPGTLMDRAVNGYIAGRGASTVECTDCFTNLTDIDNHTVCQLNVVHACY